MVRSRSCQRPLSVARGLGFAVAAAVFALAPARSSAAQPSAASPAERATQYVFVVDDSRSMREAVDGEPAADANRLAVFAVEALLSMLDPQDEVSIVRLNGGREGEAPPPIAPLAQSGARMRDLLRLDGRLASYAGDYTPCRSALEATRHLLHEGHRQNVAQVVLFLTDGQCTPAAEEKPDVDGFLDGLASHREGLLRFYLLPFLPTAAGDRVRNCSRIETLGFWRSPLLAGERREAL